MRKNVTTLSFSIPEGSTIKTSTSVLDNIPGIHGWSWEIAFLYAEAMTSICLHGNSSLIQKVALLGNEAYRKPGIVSKKTVINANGMGLADLLKFQLPSSKGKDSCEHNAVNIHTKRIMCSCSFICPSFNRSFVY